MKYLYFLCLMILLSAVTITAQEQYEHSSNEKKNYRRTDQQQTIIDPSVRNLFPLSKSTAGNEVWTELHPLIPRVIYFGVYFVNADTGWAVGEGGAIVKTTNGGQKWNWIESGVENTLKTVYSVNNGQRVIATGDGGIILISEDEGETWNTLPSGTTNNLWNMQMITEQIGWMVGEGATSLKTTDGGLTWIQQPMPHTTLPYWDVSFADTNYGYIAGNSAVILKTTNGGLDWEIQVAGDNRSLFTVYAFDSLKVIAGGFAGKVVITTDGGNNWTQLPNIQSNVNKIKFIDSLNGFAVTTGSNFQSTDGGYTWIYRPDLYNPSSTWNIDFPDLQNGYIVGARMQLMKTTDAGVSWNKTIINDDFLNVYFKDEMNGFLNSGSKIYKTTDGGTTLTVLESFPYNDSHSTRAMTFIDSLTGYVGSGTYQQIYKTTNAGIIWDSSSIIGLINTSALINKIFFLNSDVGWAVTSGGGIVKTTDGGDIWFAQLNILNGASISSIYFPDSMNGWATSSYVYSTINSGSEWNQRTDILINSSRDVYFLDTIRGFIIRNNSLYITTDGGFGWELDSTVAGFGLGRFSHYSLDNIFIVGIKVFKTTDGGKNWREFTEVANVGLEALSLLSAQNGYAVGETGLIIKYDETIPVELISFTSTLVENKVLLRWATATETNNAGFFVQRKKNSENDWNDLTFVSGKGSTNKKTIYSYLDNLNDIGTYQYRLKQIDFDGSFTVSETLTVEFSSPESFKLFQNYPNPFNPSTKIKFSIAEFPLLGGDGRGGFVSLKVYDVLGNEVATLVNGIKKPGYYEVNFNASYLSSGVYFYRLVAGSFVSTRKMLLLK